jgi:hypothetical protein
LSLWLCSLDLDFVVVLFARFLDRYRGSTAVGRSITVLRLDRQAEPPLNSDCHVLVDRAGVGLLFLNAKLGQQLENLVRLDFQLPRQLVDPDLQLHR